jgi:hypothetical protein
MEKTVINLISYLKQDYNKDDNYAYCLYEKTIKEIEIQTAYMELENA